MSPLREKLPSQSAALAGVPTGVQAAGPWAGRRQLFVRFAGEAETATIFTAAALAGELRRLTSRSRYHSIVLGGHDPLAESEFIEAALKGGAPLPVMLDHDGQRPDELASVIRLVELMQITLDGCETEATLERVYASLQVAAGKQVHHALAITPAESASDARLLRIVEQAHAASGTVSVVLHPTVQSASERDRRWLIWLERVAMVHDDVRLLPRLPAPTGTS
jgi:organic radical activating enzyme